MEVHHHGHVHHNKKWKEYLFQFLMLFLAVFCGFMAEYQLEHVIEHDREKQFMVSMVQDLKSDTARLRYVLKDSVRIDSIDALIAIMYSPNPTQAELRRAFSIHMMTGTYEVIDFHRNTLMQLMSGGNMRLVRNPRIVDSLSYLDSDHENCNGQRQAVMEYASKATDLSAEIFDLAPFFTKEGFRGFKYYQGELQFMTSNEKDLHRYARYLVYFNSVYKYYFYMLKQTLEFSTRQIAFIEKEYNL